MRNTYSRTFWISALAFVAFSAAVSTRLLHQFDLLTLRAVQSRTSETLDGIGFIFSTLGDVEYSGLALAVLAAGLFWAGRGNLAAHLIAAFVVTGVLEITMKFLMPQTPVQREFVRSTDPSPLIEIDYPFPYPSGHMLRSVIVLGALFVLCKNRVGRALILLTLAGMASSRIYLGVHWTSDIIGGALLGIAGLAWAFGTERREKRQR